MGSQTLLLICLGFSAIHIINGIHSWEFGKDNIPEAIITTRYRGYFTIFEKQQHIHLIVPPCHVVTYVKVQVRNLIATPKVLYNFDTNVVTIYYGFWDLSTSTFGITAKSVLQPGCQVGPTVPQQKPINPHPVQVGPARPVQPVQTPQGPPVQQRPPNGQPPHPVQVGPARPPVQPVQPPQGPPGQQRPPNGQPPHPVQVGPARPPFQPVQPPQGPPVQQRPPNGQPPHPVPVDPTRPLFRPVQLPQGPPVQQRPPNGPHDPNTIPRLNAEEQNSQKDQEDLQNGQTIQTVKDPHDPNTIPRLNSEEQNSQKNQEDLQSVPDIEHNKVTETEDGKSENNK